jgi:hypothetical protein
MPVLVGGMVSKKAGAVTDVCIDSMMEWLWKEPSIHKVKNVVRESVVLGGAKMRKWNEASFVCKGVVGAEVGKIVRPLGCSSSDTSSPRVLSWVCECSNVMVV